VQLSGRRGALKHLSDQTAESLMPPSVSMKRTASTSCVLDFCTRRFSCKASEVAFASLKYVSQRLPFFLFNMEVGRGVKGFGAAMAERRKAKKKARVLSIESAWAQKDIEDARGASDDRRKRQYEPDVALSPGRTRPDEKKNKPAMYSPVIKVVEQQKDRSPDSEDYAQSAKLRLVDRVISRLQSRVSEAEVSERFDTRAPTRNQIISLDLRNKFLSTPCKRCNAGQGRLRIFGKDQKMGLISCILFECWCGAHYSFQTAEPVETEDSRGGPKVRAVNYMGVVGSIAARHGLKGLQTFLASLDIPSLGHYAFDALMDEVVEALQTVAKRSFQAAGAAKIWPLKEKGKSAKIIVDEDGKCYEVWKIAVTFDGAWPKRGTRQAGYNWLGGMTTVMGKETGKVLDLEVLSTVCGICDRVRPAGKDVPEHKCYKNYQGNAKSMEPMGAMGVRMVRWGQKRPWGTLRILSYFCVGF
jgi:hypothetical protein